MLKVGSKPHLWVIVAVFEIGLLGLAARAAKASCRPVVEIKGDGPDAIAITADLERRGIRTSPVAGCPIVRARIEAETGGIGIADAEGRASERTTNNIASAATVIESWTRTDLLAPLLTRHLEQVQPASSLLPRSAKPTTVASGTVTSKALSTRRALSLMASGETSLATDGSIWFGLSMGACLPIGRMCAGALIRVSNDAGFSGESEEGHTTRLASDLLVGAGLPLTRGRLTLMPGIAVGAGWMRTKALRPSTDEGMNDVNSGGLRASATIRMSLSVSEKCALDFGVGADVAPLAHRAPFDAELPLVAGEPRGYLRGGLGIRIGAP